MCDRCAYGGTVFTSYSTNVLYAEQVFRLANSVVKYVNVPCLCMATTNFSISAPMTVEPIEFDASKFPIGSRYCNKMAGWRLHSFLQPALLVHLLTQGFNVFSIDADWQMVRPLATLPRYDVVALQDHEPHGHYLNVGLMYVRNTDTAMITWHVLQIDPTWRGIKA